MAFSGFPSAAVEFYQELELNNSKDWWAAHASAYQDAVKAPMLALLTDLEAEFGAAKVFRPHRDVRFSADKSPYKTHQGGYVPTADATGWYVQIGPEGLFVGAGIYHMQPDQLARYRAGVAAPLPGQDLERILKSLQRKGFEIGGEQLASRPRGVDADHPRLDLLRRKALVVSRSYGEPEWLATAETERRVRADWKAVRPFLAWLTTHVGDSERGDDRRRR